MSTTLLSFGSIATGTSSPAKVVTVTNAGFTDLEITGITMNGPGFMPLLPSPPLTILPGGVLTMYVKYTPFTATSNVVDFVMTTNDPAHATAGVTFVGSAF